MNQVIVFTNTGGGCGYCKKFDPIQNSAEFAAGLAALDAVMVVADATLNKALYTKLAQSYGKGMTAYPTLVCVGEDGKRRGMLIGRGSSVSPFTAARALALLKPMLCADCAPVPVPGKCSTCLGKKKAKCPTCGTTVKCWTCKGTGKV